MTGKLPNGQPTGLWLPELTEPLSVVQRAGIAWRHATPGGKPIKVDPQSDDGKGFLKNLCPPIEFEGVRPETFSAIYCCGGHGAMFDFPALTGLAMQFDFIAAVCHGVAILATGLAKSHFANRTEVSCFTEQEEATAGIKDQMPFSLESRLLENGYIVRKSARGRHASRQAVGLSPAKIRHPQRA